MGCNCGKNKQMKYVYVNVAKDIRQEFKSEVEARAAKIRNGGGTVTAVPK